MANFANQIQTLIKKTESPITNVDESIELLGFLIDGSFEARDIKGLRKAIEFAGEIEKKDLTSEQRLVLHYFISNAWGDIYGFIKANKPASWDWEQEEVENQIIHLRKALNEPSFSEVQKERRCQILTNLGNILNHAGRTVEAIDYWEKALKILPDFGMAQANLAKGLAEYGNSLHKPHDAILILNKAHKMLKGSLELQGFHPEAIEHFQDYLQRLDAVSKKFAFGNHKFEKLDSFGETDEEILYRKWALKNKLFLNHLNDLDATIPEAAVDNLTLPPIVRPIEEKSSHFEGLLNQIKQEFVSARYLYFEGISANEVHFSDKKVALYNTLDYPSYSIAVEKIKISFRLSYSILDKIAYFLNEYLNLSIPQNKVTFRTFWYNKMDKQKGLRNEFTNRENWILRGLFWLSKDLYENSEMFKKSIEPEGQELSDIRNHLEHKYLKVHEFGPLSDEFREDSLAYSIGRIEMSEKSLKVLMLARAAIIYLTLAIHTEEIHKEKNRKDKGKIGQIFIDILDDEWKF